MSDNEILVSWGIGIFTGTFLVTNMVLAIFVLFGAKAFGKIEKPGYWRCVGTMCLSFIPYFVILGSVGSFATGLAWSEYLDDPYAFLKVLNDLPKYLIKEYSVFIMLVSGFGLIFSNILSIYISAYLFFSSKANGWQIGKAIIPISIIVLLYNSPLILPALRGSAI
jgi:hypothetical protein